MIKVKKVQTLRLVVFFLLIVEAAGSQDTILGGMIVTRDRVIPKGWITIRRGRIESVSEHAPTRTNLTVVDTGGIIFPGFIDLHNHPMYDAFPRWRPNTKFKNRYEWRDLEDYKKILGDLGSALQKKSDQTFCDLAEYAEVKALAGGTTSISGISPRRDRIPAVPDCLEGLIRDLDWASDFHEAGVGHERIKNALGVTPHDLKDPEAIQLREELAGRKLDLLLIHVGEGSPQDLESSIEFFALEGRGLLSSRTAVIHGTALTNDNFRQMHAAGAALIWSPRSNIELYGATTDVAAALREGVTVALAPDWSPTGSTNTLAELAYASRYSREHLGGLVTNKMLFQMSTATPAKIARIEDKVGALEAGKHADLFVLRAGGDPYEALAAARPQDVQLVLVNGVPLYGSEKLMGPFGPKAETVDVCGEKMVLNSGKLPSGAFAEVQHRLENDLKDYGVALAPLAECDR